MQADGLVDLLVELAASPDVVRRKPAAYALGLQVCMKPLGELLIAGRIADEAGVELDGPSRHRADEVNELVGNAAAAQECLGNLAARLVDCVDANCGRPAMFDGFETLGATEINISKVRCCCPSRGEVRPAEVCLVEVRPHEVSLAEVRLAEVRPPKVYPAEVRPAEVRRSEVRLAEVRLAEVRPPKVCPSEFRAAEVRPSEVRAA